MSGCAKLFHWCTFLIQFCKGYGSAVYYSIFSPDSSMLYTSGDQVVRVYDTSNFQGQYRIKSIFFCHLNRLPLKFGWLYWFQFSGTHNCFSWEYNLHDLRDRGNTNHASSDYTDNYSASFDMCESIHLAIQFC